MLEEKEVLLIKGEIAREIRKWPDYQDHIYTIDIETNQLYNLSKAWLEKEDIDKFRKESDVIFIALYKSTDGNYYFLNFAGKLPLKLLKKVKV